MITEPTFVENYRVDLSNGAIKSMGISTLIEGFTGATAENTASKISRCLLVDPVSRLILNRGNIPQSVMELLGLDPKEEIGIFEFIPNSESYQLANALVTEYK